MELNEWKEWFDQWWRNNINNPLAPSVEQALKQAWLAGRQTERDYLQQHPVSLRKSKEERCPKCSGEYQPYWEGCPTCGYIRPT